MKDTIALKAMTRAAMPALEVAAGSVAGVDHRRRGRGRQDAYAWHRRQGSLVAAVCDGCGSGSRSEVGAALGARILSESLSVRLGDGMSVGDPLLWQRTRADLLTHLRLLASAMGGRFDQVIAEHFLFTVVGVAVTPATTALFAVGDGLVAVDGELRQLGPFADNSPPYLGYDLVRSSAQTVLEPFALFPTARFSSIVIATDGALELDDVTELPAIDHLFRNRDALRRRLELLANERWTADWGQQRLLREGGLLSDDTTVLAIRKARA